MGNRIQFMMGGGKAGRSLGIYFGIMLVIISALVFIFPTFFAFVFAGIVGFFGLFLLLSAIFSTTAKPPRQHTEEGTYQEIEDQ